MGNLINTIKRFFTNKNTVTIVGVLAGVVVLWVAYTMRVNKATNPIKIPYAKEEITAASEITEDLIGYIEVNDKFLANSDVYQNVSELIGKYVNSGTSIPSGGLFYKSQIVEKSALNNTIFDNMEDGYMPFVLKVDNHSTYGNAIFPGDKIDLFMKATDENGKLVYGKFVESITVLAVRDSTGKNVFDTNPPRTPAELVFSVDEDMGELLQATNWISGITLVPVPRNEKYSETDGTVKTYEYFKNLIEANMGTIG